MPAARLRIETVVSTPFEENGFLVFREGDRACLVIDPGLEPEAFIEQIEALSLEPVAILNTHGHSDHIGGNAAVKARWPEARVIIGRGDARKLTDAWENLSAHFGASIVSPAADQTVSDGDIVELAGVRLMVREIPGHTTGHVVYICAEEEPPVVFVGDVIFAGSIGRTDFPGGDHDALLRGIREKIYTLPNETQLLPGHGPATTVGRERRSNPFVRG